MEAAAAVATEYLLAAPDAETSGSLTAPLQTGPRGVSGLNDDDDSSVRSWTMSAVLCCKFCLAQLLVNMVLSFAFPLGFFWVIFYPHTATAPTSYAVMSPQVLVAIVASPWMCAVVSGGLLPMSMPEAFQSGWFGTLSTRDARRLHCVLPCLRSRYGLVRHLALGTLVAPAWISAMLVLLRHFVGTRLSATLFIYLVPAYIATLPLVLLPLAVLGFAAPASYARVRETMPMHGSVIGKGIRRLLYAPLC